MSEQPEIQTFIRKGPDGDERTFQFAPWPEGQVQVRFVEVEVPGGDGELRHLSYDDPPGAHVGVTPEDYRRMLASAVGTSSSEAEFTAMLVMALGRDLVWSHGVRPDVAIEAVTDFARKVYAEFSA